MNIGFTKNKIPTTVIDILDIKNYFVLLFFIFDLSIMCPADNVVIASNIWPTKMATPGHQLLVSASVDIY